MNKQNIKLLFDYARKSINARFENKEFNPENVPEELNKKSGVFVTITINNQLRGCIGVIKPMTLWKTVIQSARSSAFSDPRFNPLSKEEFNKIIIEISILSKPVETTINKIKSGDGVILSKGFKTALFLPQVWDQLPNKDEFIQNLKVKAGLMPNEEGVAYQKFIVQAWKETTEGGIQLVE